MTTIAWDMNELVTDSRQTLRDMILPGAVNKIVFPEEGEYWEVAGTKCLAFALAGMFSGVPYIKEMLAAGMNHRSRFPEDVEMIYNAIFILEDRTAWVQTVIPNKGRTVTLSIPATSVVAIGSGEAYAYSMLAIGKSAQSAVKHAMKLDPYSGGELNVFVMPPKPEVPSKRPEAPKPLATDNSPKLGDLSIDQLKAVIKSVTDASDKPLSEEMQEAARDAGPQKVKAAPYEAA